MLGSQSTERATWKWEFLQIKVVGVWAHKTKSIKILGREIPGALETLTFYSNGRVNDPIGTLTWQRKGRNLNISWGEGKTTVATISPDGKSYSGKTTRPTGIGKTTLTFPTIGRYLGDSK